MLPHQFLPGLLKTIKGLVLPDAVAVSLVKGLGICRMFQRFMLIQIFIVRFLWREFSWQYFVILWQYFAQCISMYLLTILSIFSCSCYRSRNWCDRQISSGQAIWRSIEVMDPSERAHNSSPQNSTWPVQFSMVPGWWFGTFGLFFHILLGIMINIWINIIGIIFPYYYLNNDPNNIFFFPYIGNVIIPTDELHTFSEG